MFESETFTYNNFLVLLTVATFFLKLCAVFEGHLFDVTGLHDACWVDRFGDPNQSASPLTSNILLWGTKLLALFVMAQHYYYTRDARHGNIRWKHIKVPISLVWEMTTYSALHFLRAFLGDHKCHDRPNSISGHYWFYIFYLLTLLFLIVDLKRSTHHFEHFFSPHIVSRIVRRRMRFQALSIVFSYLAFAALAMLTLYRTWAYGFHTQAQIHYGIFFALGSHYSLIKIFDFFISEHNNKLTTAGIIFLAVTQVTIFSIDALYTQMIPWDMYSTVLNILAWWQRPRHHSPFVSTKMVKLLAASHGPAGGHARCGYDCDDRNLSSNA